MYPTLSSEEHSITKRELYNKNWKSEQKLPRPHKKVHKKGAPVVYGRPGSFNQVVGFLPEHALYKEPPDKLRAEEEIESGM